MKYIILSVRDKVAEVFGTPYYAVSKGSAIRGFSDEINRPAENNQLYQHPHDFVLCYLGTFDDFDCTFELNATPETLITGSDCKQPIN
jgi:hypothetical protein